MSKNEFMNELERRIKKYPDHSEIISYYYELISDKMDSGMTESEAVESLGSLDEICRNIENERASIKEEVKVEEIKAETTSTTEVVKETTNEPKRVNGGKRFVYVLWIIGTVFMSIFSIVTLIVAISFMITTIAIMVSSATVVAVSVSMASFYFGIGLFLFGMAIVGIHYAKVLVKFVFHNRPRWTQNVRKGLAGE